MVGYEMLAQVQRDLTAEQVNLTAIADIVDLIMTILFVFVQAAAKLQALPEKHYKSTV